MEWGRTNNNQSQAHHDLYPILHLDLLTLLQPSPSSLGEHLPNNRQRCLEDTRIYPLQSNAQKTNKERLRSAYFIPKAGIVEKDEKKKEREREETHLRKRRSYNPSMRFPL